VSPVIHVLLLTVEETDTAAEHVQVCSEEVLCVCAFLAHAMRDRLAYMAVYDYSDAGRRGSSPEWTWRPAQPTRAQRRHLAELDQNRAKQTQLASTARPPRVRALAGGK
jgi:hypothetical protein